MSDQVIILKTGRLHEYKMACDALKKAGIPYFRQEENFSGLKTMTSIYLFIAASTVLIVTPGPDIIFVLTHGMSGGRIAGIMSAIGVTSGILVHTAATSLGLAVLLQTSTYAFWTMKIIGGCYLINLGIQMVRKRKDLILKQAEKKIRTGECILQGFLSNVFNPKVALFFVAFLPQFIHPSVQNQSIDMILGPRKKRFNPN